MKDKTLKKHSYLSYPYKKGEHIDSIEILEENFVFKSDRYMVRYKCDCGNIECRRLQHLQRLKYKCCKKCSRTNNYPNQRKTRASFKEGIHQTWMTTIDANLKRGESTLINELTFKDLLNILEKQNYKCPLTGIKLDVLYKFKYESNASIDRIDSDKNYTVDNVQWVYKPVNIMKNNFHQNEFIEICKLIADYIR